MPHNDLALPDPMPVAPPPALGNAGPLEPLIAECMCAASIQLLVDMIEFDFGRRPAWSGGCTAGGNRFAELYELRAAALATNELAPLSFEQVARVWGGAALYQRAGGRLSEHLLETLIDGVLEVLGKVVHSQLN